MAELPILMDLEVGGLRQTLYQLDAGWGLVRHYNQNRNKGKYSVWYETLSPDDLERKMWRILDQEAGQPPDVVTE